MLLQFAARHRFGFAATVVCCTICATGILNSARAQEKEIEAKSFRDRVCDLAILSDGARLTGIALSDSPVRLVLRPERLKADAPNLYTEEIKPVIADQLGNQNKELIAILRQRIDQLKIDAPDDRQQIGLLEEVIERLHPNDSQAPPWIIVEIEPKRLKRLETLAPNRRELARFALLNQIDDFESLHWKTVTTRLQAIPAAQLKHPTAASQQTPPDVIAERILAAVDVRLNKATRLIRTGDAFVAEDAKPDLATLMSSLLGDSLNKTLQDLLNETGGLPTNPLHDDKQNNPALPEAAIRLAESNGHSTVVVSTFDFDLARGAASVSRQLFRNSKVGGWKHLSATTGSSTTNDVTPEQVQKIEEDPQVKQISGLLSQLSADPNSLKTALQMGAVVQSALSKAEAAFQATIQDLITARSVNDETPTTIVLKAPAN
ncbi:MAG: hypothetical protein O2856_09270 [Planctomycetota bacterium]|nr:hypothetical protein [Planctomycetota bacterium]